MDIRLYNTLTRKKDAFEPLDQDMVGVYTCGPTVYQTASIGNFRSFLFADILVRTLRYNGLSVRWIMNITDVGHLVSDGDDGEDKVQKQARAQGKTAWDISKDYTDQFLLDMDRFGIVRPDQLPKATDHIEEQINIVKALEANGHTYQTSDGIYFDTSTIEEYGSLSGQSVDEKQEGARVTPNSEKRNPTDFALWKFSPEGERRDMEWGSPWGMGFPGWHIECTAMSTKYLGDLYDIHTGGEDHKMVHHPNEIAQSQGSLGTTEAQVWMHNAFLQVDGGRMGKSLGNAYTADDLIKKEIDPIAFRYLVLTADYRQPLNFTWESVQAAQSALKRLRETVRAWETPTGGIPEYEKRFLEAVNDDLDTPRAIASIWDMVNDASYPTGAKAQVLLKFDQVLGLQLADYIARPLVIPEDIQKLVDEREMARNAKDWGESDRLRDAIKEKGFLVEDMADGQKVSEL